MKKLSIILLILFVFALVCACSTPPKEEMEKAHNAVTRAENDADAVTYASNTLVRARDALTRMQNEADAKRYDAAKTYAADAVTQAERAIVEGKSGAARIKDEAENLINSLAGPLAETSNSLDAAWKTKELRLDFAALTTDLESANKTYGDAKQSLQGSRYREAISQGQTVRSILAGINSVLTEEVIAVARKQ